MSEHPNGKYVELMKNTGLLAIGSFSSKILVFLMVPLYTSILSTAEVGVYDLLVSTAQLLIPLLTLNVADGVLRLTLDNKENTNSVFIIAIKFSLLSIMPILIAALLVRAGIILPQFRSYSLFFLAYYVTFMLNQLLVQFAKAADRIWIMSVSGIIGTFVSVALCVFFLAVWKLGIYGFFTANILGQLVPAVYLTVALKLWPYLKMPTNPVLLSTIQRSLLLYTVPLIANSVGWWLNNTVDKYVVTVFSGVEINGLLSVAYKLPSMMAVVIGIFTQAWQISAMKEYGKESSSDYYNRTFIYLNVFVYFMASAVIMGTRLFAKLFFAKEFYNAWFFVPYLVVSAAFTASSGYIAPILTSAYKTWSVSMSTVISGIINIFLNILLICLVGDIGVAAATMLSSFLVLYFRYKAADGMISAESFMRVSVLWTLLVIQAALEVFQLEPVQIPCVFLVVILFRCEITAVIRSVFRFLGR